MSGSQRSTQTSTPLSSLWLVRQPHSTILFISFDYPIDVLLGPYVQCSSKNTLTTTQLYQYYMYIMINVIYWLIGHAILVVIVIISK
jgi:hypothetical protein